MNIIHQSFIFGLQTKIRQTLGLELSLVSINAPNNPMIITDLEYPMGC